MVSSAVFSTITDGDTISFAFVSDMEHVHPTIHLSEKFAQECGARDTSKIGIVLRELLSNAIVHGNRNLPELLIRCTVEHLSGKQFRIVVEDEGEGFDFDSLNTAFPDDPRNIRNRGYILIHSLCSALKFNERGNQVTVLLQASENGAQAHEGKWATGGSQASDSL